MSQQPSVAPPAALGGLGPADIWRVVRKRLWLIIACFVVFGLGGTGGLVAWYYLAPFYTAEGLVEVEPGTGTGFELTRGYQSDIPVPLFEQYVGAQVLAVRSDRVLSAAIEALKGQQTVYTGPTASYDLGLDLQVLHQLNTQTIFVRLRGTSREQIQAIVREVLMQYIGQLNADRSEADTTRQRELRAERDDLRKQLDDLARLLARARGEGDIIVSDERASEPLARLVALVRQLTDAQGVLAESNSAWVQFQELKKQADEAKDYSPVLMAFPEMMDALRTDRNVAVLTDQMGRLSQELLGMKQRFGERHEAVKRLEAAVQSSKNDLDAKQNDLLGQLFQQQAATLKSKLDRTRTTEAELQSRVAEARAAAVDAARKSSEYRAREDEFRRVQNLLSTVMDGLERMRISSALSRPNVRIARVPQIPIEPSEPQLLLYIPGAIIFSLVLGLALAVLFEVLDTRLRTPAEVVRGVGVPLLASVPDLTEDERLSLDTNVGLVSQGSPQSLLAESFRQLRTSLLFASDHPVKSLLVVSPNPGDGKSAVAANLAITMARSGSRVLLIEANFRRPALARLFDLPDGVGLSNVLVGMNRPAEAIQATAIENLDVLVGGAVPPSPAELLGSQSMRQLIADQTKAYDQVIIDGAPMLVVADNHLLAEAVDGVVLVFCAGENTRGMALRSARQIVTLRARLLGAVLNRVRATKGGYFRESFQAYYDYSGAAPAARPAPAARRSRPSAPPADGGPGKA